MENSMLLEDVGERRGISVVEKRQGQTERDARADGLFVIPTLVTYDILTLQTEIAFCAEKRGMVRGMRDMSEGG